MPPVMPPKCLNFGGMTGCNAGRLETDYIHETPGNSSFQGRSEAFRNVEMVPGDGVEPPTP